MIEWKTWPLVEDLEREPFDGRRYIVEQVWYNARTKAPQAPSYHIAHFDDGEWLNDDGEAIDAGAATRYALFTAPAPLNDQQRDAT